MEGIVGMEIDPPSSLSSTRLRVTVCLFGLNSVTHQVGKFSQDIVDGLAVGLMRLAEFATRVGGPLKAMAWMDGERERILVWSFPKYCAAATPLATLTP